MMVGSDAASPVARAGTHAAANGVRGCVHTREGIKKEETIEHRIIHGTAGIYIGSAHVDARKVRLLLYERLLLRAAKSRSILDPWCVVARAHS